MSELSTLARRAAAKIMVNLAETEPSDECVSESVGNGFREVIVIIRPVRLTVARDLDMHEFKRELSEKFGLNVMGLGRPEQPAPRPELRPIHGRILEKLTRQAVGLRAVARLMGLSFRSSHLKQGLADLVRWGLILRGESGYSLPS
jgi:hypothetical protein